MSDESETMVCPRRAELFQRPTEKSADCWEDRAGARACSYCGSAHPDDFMRLAAEGATVLPTDKDYKTYVGPAERKFYYPHLSADQRRAFVELYNQKKVNIGYPGHFYVLPYFMRRA